MKKNNKRTLTPKLRFPEFRENDAWNETTLGQICGRITNGKANAEDHEEGGAYPLFDRSAVIKRSNSFLFDAEAVILPGEGMRFEPKYFRGKFNLHQRAYALFECKGDARFVYYFMDKSKELLARKAVKSTVLSLRLPIIEKFEIAWPEGIEQQKIADCLSSLDGLIAGEGRKMEALRAHKKGLMQQLFPRPGETRPRLRFPEFRNAGEWRETKLSQLGKLVSGLTYSPEDVRDNGLLVLRSSNIQNGEIALDDCVYVTPTVKGANLAKPNDILICVRNGSKPLIGKNAMIPDGMPKCTHGAFMTVLRAHAACFVFQLLQTSAFQKQVAADLGATINSINGSNLLKYRFFVPEPLEQERIAACLASISDLIAAQAQRLNILHTHKKGLMQQLFPAPEDN